jgi:hypothetical protein
MDQHLRREGTELLRQAADTVLQRHPAAMGRLLREVATGLDLQQADTEHRRPVDTVNEARTYRRKEWVKK